MIHAVILAGGVGTRFWPVSRVSRPKQFLDILGTGHSLLELSYERATGLADQLWVVGHRRHEKLLGEHLPTISPARLLLEPLQRDTAPAILWATSRIYAEDPEAVLWILPADHYVPDLNAFRQLMRQIFQRCDLSQGIYTVGIRPTHPHTGYGYIQYVQAPEHQGPCYKVKTFTEKPSKSLAEVFLQSGDFLWNSGMFIAKADTLRKAYQIYAPEIYELLADAEALSEEALQARLQHCPAISFDYAIMEKYPETYVVEGNFRWWDLGSWEAVYQVAAHDQDGNVCRGQVYTDGVHNSFILSTSPQRLIYVVGLSDVFVLDTSDALLILPRAQEQHVRHIVSRLQSEGKTNYL